MSVASPNFLEQHPELFTGFYAHRLNMYRETMPHEGYSNLLKKIESHGLDYHVMTTNVDGHFIKAGYDPKRVFERHGSIHHYQCSDWQCANREGLSEAPASLNSTSSLCPSFVPKCSACGEVMRPNILMFNDYNMLQSRCDEQEVRYRRWINGKMERDKRVLILEIGAGPGIPSLRIEHNQRLMNDPEWFGIRVNPNPEHAEATKYNMKGFTGTTIDFITKIM